jgi:hypothetical protein
VQQNESRPRKSVACWQPAGRAVITGRRSREARKIYFTNRTLSRNKGLFAFDPGRRLLLPMVSWGSVVTFISPAALCLETGVFSPLTTEAANSCQLALAARSQDLFHQSHFDWSLERFSVPDAAGRPESRRVDTGRCPQVSRTRYLWHPLIKKYYYQ